MPVKGCRSIPWLYARLLSNSVPLQCHTLFGSEHPFYRSISEDFRDNSTCCRAPGDRTVSTRIQYIYLFCDDFCTHTFNDRNSNTYRLNTECRAKALHVMQYLYSTTGTPRRSKVVSLFINCLRCRRVAAYTQTCTRVRTHHFPLGLCPTPNGP